MVHALNSRTSSILQRPRRRCPSLHAVESFSRHSCLDPERSIPCIPSFSSATNKDKHLPELSGDAPAKTSPLPADASRAPAGDQGPECKEEPPVAMGAPATALVLKFQPNSKPLPSEQEVRARFARFGPLENDGRGTRVSTETNMGMVVYKFMSHAESALSYSRNRAMFGDQIEYRGYLVDFGAPPLRAGPSTPGGSGMNPASVSVGRQPIKSILRKRERDDHGYGASAAGGAPRGTRRVRFSVDIEGEPPASPASSNDGGSSSADEGHDEDP